MFVKDTLMVNKCNPAIFFSKDLKLSVPASQQVWPNILTAKIMTKTILNHSKLKSCCPYKYNLCNGIIFKLYYFSIT